MVHREIARELVYSLRQLLIAHVDKPQPIVIGSEGTYFNVCRLIKRDLLRGCKSDGGAIYLDRGRPTHSKLTDDGRRVLCWILAEYAEGLIAAAQLDEQEALQQISLAPEINGLLVDLWQRRHHGERAQA